MSRAIEAFHAHLDTCRQCEQHPFDLCPTGTQLIQDIENNRHPSPAPAPGRMPRPS